MYLFSEYIGKHSGNGILEMSDMDAFVYDNSLYLIKCIIMRCVDIFISEHSSWDNCPNWELFVAQNQILHTGSLGGEDSMVSLKPKCILHIACWVRFWDIYTIKVQIFCGDFHRFIHLKSHTDKGIFDFLLHLCDRVEASVMVFFRKSEVLPFISESFGNYIRLDASLFSIKCFREYVSAFIGEFSYCGTFLYAEVFESFENRSKLTGFSEDSIFIFYERCFTLKGREGSEDSELEL